MLHRFVGAALLLCDRLTSTTVISSALFAACLLAATVRAGAATAFDFNADGKSDILWRNVSTGNNYLWLMNGTSVAGSGPLPTIADLNWQIVGVGDFDGDGKADILWRNVATGANYIWLMNGTSVASSGPLPSIANLNWQVVGIGDFDGDGKADILWRNSGTGEDYVWLMNGMSVASSGPLPQISNLNWQVAGTGDFDGDGKADVLWRNLSSGATYVWLMNGTSVASSGPLPQVSDLHWQIAGVGDFDGDGKADVLWRNSATGEDYLWLMNGMSVASSGPLPQVSDVHWQIVAVGDFDGGGKADIFWRNASTGENYLWLMNGFSVAGQGPLPQITDLNWQVFDVTARTTVPVAQTFPSSNHVFVIMEENQSFSEVFPNGTATNCGSSGMPYLCSLAASNGMALNFYANEHGSLLSYLWVTSGADWSTSPYNCTGSNCASLGVITGDNIVAALKNAGKTWRGYFEGMPSEGYLGGDTNFYVQHHNPFIWYSAVANSTTEAANMFPFTQFAQDVKNGTFRNFNFIVPDVLDDADGTGTQTASALLVSADSWLQTNIAPLLATAPFQSGGDGILIVTFDEGSVAGKSGNSTSDNACSPTQSSGCGGHVAFVMVGPNVKPASTTSNTYHFQNMLHTVLHLLGITDYMNGSSGAADIALLPGT